MTRIAIIILLTLMWAALWQDASPGTLLAGAAVATTVTLVTPMLRGATWGAFPRPVATIRFLLGFGGNLVRATATVAWEVATPTIYIREGIIAVPLATESRAVLTLVANAVSVTPGTVTVDVGDPGTLYIHVMHLGDVEEARQEVRRLEELAIRAFGSPADRERLDARGGPR